ncbi:MAG: hypothetical protein HFG28_08555 [Eubacterium sp.]|nr:hypothetical protein [Eubacterium sp.]
MIINLKEELRKLKIYKISNEELYKLSEFEEKLKLTNIKTFESDDLIIMPYYIDNNKIYELYAYELNVRIVDKIDFDTYIKKITGKEKIEDIPDNIIILHKHCYIGITNNQGLSKEKLYEYIIYLQNSQQIKEEIQKTFSTYDKDKLYFEIY